MLKLKRYLTPYLGIFLIGVALLFSQALLDLNLPNLMSKIVDVGIQKEGIAEAAPEAIPSQYFALLQRFMPESDALLTEKSYVAYAQITEQSTRLALEKKFPAITDDVMVRAETEADSAALEAAFGRASYALTQFAMEAAKSRNVQLASASTNTAEFDLDSLDALLPAIDQISPELFASAVAMAAGASGTELGNVAAVLNKAFYLRLDANIGAIETTYILRTGGLMLLLCLLTVLCAGGAGLCFSRMGAGVARDLRLNVYQKVTDFTNNELDHFSTSSLITRTTNDITQVQMFLTMGVRMLCLAPIMGAGGIIMALGKSSGMAWIIAVAVLAIVGVISIIFSVAMPRFNIMQKLVDRLNLVSRENLSGMMVIRAFGTQRFEEGRFDKANTDLSNNNLIVHRVISVLMPAMMLVMNGITLFIVWLGAQQIARSTMQVGDMMAFIQYAMQIIMSFLMISMMFIMLPRASVSANRIQEVLASEPAVRDAASPKHLASPVRGLVEFHDVSFKYQGADENVLEHISFEAKPGETTAFIGATGSGKSTLINLIPRFYDVSSGSITLDGIDLRELPQHELRDKIGYVPQKGVLLSGDIASNLLYSDPNAGEEIMQKAVEVAQASEFIQRLDDGFSTEISQGGTNVSGGQRQRLSIARALVKKAPVYIFDDSFSALDFATDAKLRKALAPYTVHSAVLIVAQRVSTIMYADKIVVLDEGRVAGIGSHQELLRTCPTYREIAESQLSKEELA